MTFASNLLMHLHIEIRIAESKSCRFKKRRFTGSFRKASLDSSNERAGEGLSKPPLSPRGSLCQFRTFTPGCVFWRPVAWCAGSEKGPSRRKSNCGRSCRLNCFSDFHSGRGLNEGVCGREVPHISFYGPGVGLWRHLGRALSDCRCKGLV